MKKRVKKLRLGRETLRRLDDLKLGDVAGGSRIQSNCDACQPSDQTAVCGNCSGRPSCQIPCPVEIDPTVTVVGN
jgi:hypothetical protein